MTRKLTLRTRSGLRFSANEWDFGEIRFYKTLLKVDDLFFCLIILAFDLYRSWRHTFCPVFLSAVRAVAARCKLPFFPPPRPVPKKSRRAQGN